MEGDLLYCISDYALIVLMEMANGSVVLHKL